MDLFEEPVEFSTADGFKIKGTLLWPESPRRVALLLHGITLSRDEFGSLYRDLAAELATRGIASLRFDFRGHGESAGLTTDISVIGECLDIRAAISFLRGRSPVGAQVVATSFSAGPSIFVALDSSLEIERLALIAPVLNYERTFLCPSTPWGEKWFGSKAIETSYREGYALLETSRLGVRLFEEFRTLSPGCALRQLKAPILAIHGDRDSMVPFDATVEYLQNAQNAELKVLEGADHGFLAAGDQTGETDPSRSNKRSIIHWVADFLEDPLRGPSSSPWAGELDLR